MTHLDRWRRDLGAAQHGQRVARVRFLSANGSQMLAVLHRDNRHLHIYACLGAAVPSGRLSCRARLIGAANVGIKGC
jgi:hypothetical protein